VLSAVSTIIAEFKVGSDHFCFALQARFIEAEKLEGGCLSQLAARGEVVPRRASRREVLEFSFSLANAISNHSSSFEADFRTAKSRVHLDE
jgi:hypothetical protein